MCRSHAGKTLCLGLDYRLEIIAAVGALLPQVGADGGEIVLGKHFR